MTRVRRRVNNDEGEAAACVKEPHRRSGGRRGRAPAVVALPHHARHRASRKKTNAKTVVIT